MVHGLYIHTQVVMRYGNEMIHVSPPGLLLSTVLPTSMMLKNSASCSIGSLKSSLSMCDKMVAGKKYLSGGVCEEREVCGWRRVCVCGRYWKRMAPFSFHRTGNGTSLSYLQLLSSS